MQVAAGSSDLCNALDSPKTEKVTDTGTQHLIIKEVTTGDNSNVTSNDRIESSTTETATKNEEDLGMASQHDTASQPDEQVASSPIYASPSPASLDLFAPATSH